MCAALALAAAVAVDVGQDAPLHATMRYDCGAGVPCTMQVEPWGDNSLRVRVAPGSAVLDDAEGALGRVPPARTTAARVDAPGSIANGAIRAAWTTGGALAFFRGDTFPLLLMEKDIFLY